MNTSKIIQNILLQHHIKPSVQRIAIMEFLMENKIHPTADEIYNKLSKNMLTLSKTTVYNTLNLFVEQDVLIALGIDDKNIRFDIDTSDHAHFMCIKCGDVMDIVIPAIQEVSPRKVEDGFSITEMHLYYKGFCPLCKRI